MVEELNFEPEPGKKEKGDPKFSPRDRQSMTE